MRYRVTTTTTYAFPRDTKEEGIRRVLNGAGDRGMEWVMYHRPETNEVVYKTAKSKVIDTTPRPAPVIPDRA